MKQALSIRLDIEVHEKINHMGKNKAGFIAAAIEEKLNRENNKLNVLNEKLKSAKEAVQNIEKQILLAKQEHDEFIEKNKDKANKLFREIVDEYKSVYNSRQAFIHSEELFNGVSAYVKFSGKERPVAMKEILNKAKEELGIKEGDNNGRE